MQTYFVFAACPTLSRWTTGQIQVKIVGFVHIREQRDRIYTTEASTRLYIHAESLDVSPSCAFSSSEDSS